jgi:hypothetical protein
MDHNFFKNPDPASDPDPKPRGKWDPDPKEIVSVPQQWSPQHST